MAEPIVDPNQVYSAANVQATQQAPTPAPDDLLGIRSSIQAELGIPQLQTQYNDLYKAYLGGQSSLEKQQADIMGQALNMQVLRGETARARELAAPELAAQGRGLQAIGQNLAAAQMEASERFGIRSSEVQEKKNLMAQYPGAGIKFSDSFDKAIDRLEDYQKELEKDAEKDAYKDALRSMGLSTKGSRGELEDRLRDANRAEYNKAQRIVDLQIQGLEADLSNTRSIIANRGKAEEDILDEGELIAWADAVQTNPQMFSSVPKELQSSVLQLVDRNIFLPETDIGYSTKEQNQLRTYGIDPSDTGNADQFLYGDGLTPEERAEAPRWWQFWK